MHGRRMVLAAASLIAWGCSSGALHPSATSGRGTTGGASGSSGSTGTSSTTGSSGSSGTSTGSTGSSGTTVTTAGPWPTAHLTSYGAADGLGEPTVDVSTDEAQNIWAVSNQALYILRPGQTQFHRYTNADGLHLATSAPPGIMTIAGGHANEGFVGYNDADIVDVQRDPNRFLGKMDHVALNADGTLVVTHLDIHNDDYVLGSATDGGITDSDFSFNEDRGARRMLYDHTYHPGTLYVGWNHGVDRIDWGHPDPKSGLPYADHVHPTVYTPGGTQMMGEWRGLALDPTPCKDASGQMHPPGVLWMGGEYTGGALDWTPALYDWSSNPANPFVIAFDGPPIFPVAQGGDSVNVRAIAVTHDGSVWYASGPQWNPSTDPMRGIAQWHDSRFTYYDPGAIGLPTRAIMDMTAMPDDTLEIATEQGLFRWNPQRNTLAQEVGLPSDDVLRLWLDTQVAPPSLYVVTSAGFSVLR